MSHSTRHKRRRSRSNDRFDTQMIANGVLLILFALLAGIASYTMYAHNILAFRHVNVIYTAVLVVVFLVCLLLTLFKKGKHLVTVLLVLFRLSLVFPYSPLNHWWMLPTISIRRLVTLKSK